LALDGVAAKESKLEARVTPAHDVSAAESGWKAAVNQRSRSLRQSALKILGAGIWRLL
jgi:hypothetical protein